MKRFHFAAVHVAVAVALLFLDPSVALAASSVISVQQPGDPSIPAPAGPDALQASDGSLFPTTLVLAANLNGAHSVETADLDRDGKLDVIVASREDGQITWLRNLGGTQFQAQTLATALGVYMAYPADINRDGQIDIVAAAAGVLDPSAAASDEPAAVAGTGAVFWLQNDLAGSNSFVRRDIGLNLNYPVAVFPADLDGDGDLDVVAATRDDNRVTLYVNNGGKSPTFATRTIDTGALGAVSVHAADIDGDGRLDVVAASEDDNRITWYRSNGTGGFEARPIRSGSPPPAGLDYAKAVYATDVDSDGDADVVFASEQENVIGWYESVNFGASFIEHILVTDAEHAKFVTAADVDGDGDTDLLAASAYDFTVRLFENLGGKPAPKFATRIVTNTALGARAVHAADVDGDGDLDLLSASRDDDRVVLYLNGAVHRNALFNAQTESIVATYHSARSVFAADLDKDGDLDILSAADQVVAWHRNDGGSPPRFTAFVIAGNLSAGRWVSAADLDGDGDMDVMSADTKSDDITWYENLLPGPGATPSFVAHLVSNAPQEPRTIDAADLDGDGDLDLYSSSDLDNSIMWYENQGGRPARFGRDIVSDNALYVRSAFAVDVDSDGDLDLMSASANDDKVAWYENRGGSPLKWAERLIAANRNGARHIHADDIDGDGDIDIVTGSEFDNTIAWYENVRGSPVKWEQHIITNQAVAVHAVYTGDADMDGDVDIFAALEGSNTIAWYENDGARVPSFAEHIIATGALVAHGIYAADVDHDGDLDVMNASRGDGKIAWYENLGGQYSVAESRPGTTSGNEKVLLQLAIAHGGRPADVPVEMNAVTLRFTWGNTGLPLSAAQAGSLFSQLKLYRDRGGSSFESGQDILLASVNSLPLNANGELMIQLPDNVAGVQTSPGATDTYFVTVVNNSGSCRSGGEIRVANVPNGSTAQNSVTRYPLLAEYMRSLAGGAAPDATYRPGVLINEVMPENASTLLDPNEPGEYPDWIELFNSTFSDIDLGGMYLTDNANDLRLYRIPDGVKIPAFGYLVFYADGEPEQGPLHTNFKLSKSGEYVGLYDAEVRGYRLIDSVDFGPMAADSSYGRFPSSTNEWQTLSMATPGQFNMNALPAVSFFLPFVANSSGC